MYISHRERKRDRVGRNLQVFNEDLGQAANPPVLRRCRILDPRCWSAELWPSSSGRALPVNVPAADVVPTGGHHFSPEMEWR
jgi:hypothetical protein